MKVLRKALRWFGILAGAAAVYLLAVALMPGFPAPRQPLTPRPRRADDSEADESGKDEDVRIDVGDGTSLHGWLYLPPGAAEPVPCIVLAHGLGGIMEMGLDAYARRFRDAGYAVLVFDYRHFRRSDGEPRQLIWIPTQLADWRAAVQYARGRPEVDGSRVALWGTSLSGGHVVSVAAEDHAIACISAQCPGLDGHEGAEMGFKHIGARGAARLIVHGQRDLVRSWLRMSAHKIPVFGRSGTVALMASDEAWAAAEEMAPADYSNVACARITIRGDKYRPVKKAKHVRCPALFQICERDELTPVSAVEEAARRMGVLAETERYDIGHFDIYFGEHVGRAITNQIAFFNRHL